MMFGCRHIVCSTRCSWVCFFFFFQAEDGIRDLIVTGVQTCAHPICVLQNQDHGPILVHLELKNTALADGQFPAAIDAYIGEALSGASLYAASTLLGDAHSLLAAARERHWPSLAALQGHFLFCITGGQGQRTATYLDRKSTRLNSSHDQISYAVFCLKKKKTPHLLILHTLHFA